MPHSGSGRAVQEEPVLSSVCSCCVNVCKSFTRTFLSGTEIPAEQPTTLEHDNFVTETWDDSEVVDNL